MKLSLKWLNDYVDVAEFLKTPEPLSEALTRSGLEVESIENKAKDFAHVVVGHIEVKDKHPNADKLSLCQVRVDDKTVLQIVCGAQNHSSGDKVIVALPGAVLPGDFKIKKSAIRGVESSGMLCSYKELGLPDTGDGIVLLPAEAPVGRNYALYSGLDDVIFELKVTPNRADCLSHYGLARQVACVLHRPIKAIMPKLEMVNKKTSDVVKVEVNAPELCPRYAARVIKNIRVQESPAWLKQRLTAIGMNSINSIVDVTNYVMMELGQPLHAFDLKELNQSTIRVEKSQAGENFKTLKETELKLTGEELMIKDGVKSVAMAGVIGGLNSGVSDQTTDILLESAYFMSQTVRKASRSHGVETDSAYRFSRGVDPEGVSLAIDRAAEFIQKMNPQAEVFQVSDFYPSPQKKHNIFIKLQTITDRLGYAAEKDKFIQFMKGIGCDVQVNGEEFQVLPPSYRFDLETDMDLVEEYAILNGYEKLGETLPQFPSAPTANDFKFLFFQKFSAAARSLGYHQAVNYAFSNDVKQKAFIGATDKLKPFAFKGLEESIALVNPLSEDINVMKTTLSYGLFQNCAANINHGNSQGRLFELGHSFYKEGENYFEQPRAAMVFWGQDQGLWASQTPAVLQVKSHLQLLFQQLGALVQINQLEIEKAPDFLHPAQSADIIFEGEKIGFFGHVHPGILDEHKIRVPVVIMEVQLQRLLKPVKAVKSKPISKFPSVERDFAFIMDEKQAVGPLLKEIQKLAAPLLKDLRVFDVYVGDKLESGKKSVALRLKLQEENGTLQDAVVTELTAKITSKLAKDFNAHLR